MKFEEYITYDALGLAELVKQKKVSPIELLETAISRAEEVNPKVNFLIYKMYDEARKTCSKILAESYSEQNNSTNLFRGVPFLLKDKLAAYNGFPMSNGSNAFKEYYPNFDSNLVTIFKQAGLVTFGKTSTPEFGIMGITEPKAFGPCRNPWDLTRTPGGSSGGSAAAVSAGVVPIAAGADGGGSIRIPASCCGIFGLKPSRYRVPDGPEAENYWDGAAHQFIFSRSVRDSAAMLDITSTTPFNRYLPNPLYGNAGHYKKQNLSATYLESTKINPGKLLIACSIKSPFIKNYEPEIINAFNSTLRLLEDLGHNVIEDKPRINDEEVLHSYVTMLCAHVAYECSKLIKTMGKKALVKTELETRILSLLGNNISAAKYVIERAKWQKYTLEMDSFFTKYDIYLTPTIAKLPIKIGEIAPKWYETMLLTLIEILGSGKLLTTIGLLDKMVDKSKEAFPYTILANLTGIPAMNVPLTWSKNNLPIGFNFMANYSNEYLLLQLASQLENTKPWQHKMPKL